jgi:hypothetical protein
VTGPRNRALRSPQSNETTLGGTTGAGNPALTDPSPTPPTCGLKTSPTRRAKSETPHSAAAPLHRADHRIHLQPLDFRSRPRRPGLRPISPDVGCKRAATPPDTRSLPPRPPPRHPQTRGRGAPAANGAFAGRVGAPGISCQPRWRRSDHSAEPTAALPSPPTHILRARAHTIRRRDGSAGRAGRPAECPLSERLATASSAPSASAQSSDGLSGRGAWPGRRRSRVLGRRGCGRRSGTGTGRRWSGD